MHLWGVEWDGVEVCWRFSYVQVDRWCGWGFIIGTRDKRRGEEKRGIGNEKGCILLRPVM